nr:hypothetical protein [Tanacetum cinerariifolium]
MVSYNIFRHCGLHNGLTSFADISLGLGYAEYVGNLLRSGLFSPSPPANRRPATTSGPPPPPLPEKFSGEIFRQTPKLFPVSRSIQPTTTNSAAAPLLQPAPPWQPHPAATTTNNNIITIRTTLMPPSTSLQQPHAPPPSTAAAVDTTPATPSSPPLTPQLDTITITANCRTPPPYCSRHHSSHSGGFSSRCRRRGGLWMED